MVQRLGEVSAVKSHGADPPTNQGPTQVARLLDCTSYLITIFLVLALVIVKLFLLTKLIMEWKWSDEDKGWAYIRYCDKNTRSKVPANFIKYYSKGDPINTKYKYKVFWSENAQDTPVKYLQCASDIPEFELGVPDENFGETGCYRAVVYTVQDSLANLEQWIEEPSRRIRETPHKLCFSSFDVGAGVALTVNKSEAETKKMKQSSDESNKKDATTKGRKMKSRIGTLGNVKSLREKLLNAEENLPRGDDATPSKKKGHHPRSKGLPKREKNDRRIVQKESSEPPKKKSDLPQNKENGKKKYDPPKNEENVKKMKDPPKNEENGKKKKDPPQNEENGKKKKDPPKNEENGKKKKDPPKNEDNGRKNKDPPKNKENGKKSKDPPKNKDPPKGTENEKINDPLKKEEIVAAKKNKFENIKEHARLQEAKQENIQIPVNPSDLVNFFDIEMEEENFGNPDSPDPMTNEGSESTSSEGSTDFSGDEKSDSSSGNNSDSSDQGEHGSLNQKKQLFRKFHKRKAKSDSSDDDVNDLSITSPRKVAMMESDLAVKRQELRKAAAVAERLRAENEKLRQALLSDKGIEDAKLPAAPITQASGNNESHTGLDDCEELPAPKENPVKSVSKRQQKLIERDKKRASITSLVPIPETYDYENVEQFNISAKYVLKKEIMQALWKIGLGDKKDSEFIKTAAVGIFGSDTLVSVGVVKGITKKGVKKEGLDEAALEGIRVLLILRARREGVDVQWNTERTKQARVNAAIADKIKSLNISAVIRAAAAQKASP